MSENEPGVYLLFLRQRLVYVGKSKTPHKRVETHRRNGRPFDHVLFVPCAPRDVDWVEVALIKAFAPPQNRQGLEGKDGSFAYLPEEPPKVVHVTYQQAAPLPPPPPVPMRTLPTHRARWLVRPYGLGREFDEAVKDRSIRWVWRNPAHTEPGSRRLFAEADVKAWIEEAVQARYARSPCPPPTTTTPECR